jgi:hypothetical protein
MLTDSQKFCHSVVNILELLKIESDVLQPDGLLPYEDKTYKDISNKIGRTEDKTVDEIVEIVKKVKPDKKSGDVERRARQAGDVAEEHGNKVAQPSSDVVKDNSIVVYTDVKDKLDDKFGKSVIGKQFGVADELAIELINDWTHVFIGEHYKHEVSQLVIDEIITAFAEGEALAVADIAARLDEALPGLIKQKGIFFKRRK